MKNNEERKIRRENKLFDLSQHSNMSCFRNERVHKGSGFILDDDFFDGINEYTGIISFDFVSSVRPEPNSKITDWEFVKKMADHLCLITNDEIKSKQIELTIDDEDVFSEELKGFKWLLRDCTITTNILINILNNYAPPIFLHIQLDLLTYFFPNIIDLENFMDICIRRYLTETLVSKTIDVIGVLNVINPVYFFYIISLL